MRRECTLKVDIGVYHLRSVLTLLTTRSAFSNAINQSRLRVLRAREELLAKIVADAQKRLASMGQPGEPYKKLLRDLILQVHSVAPVRLFTRSGRVC